MRALFVMDPLSTILVDQDSSYALASRLEVGPRPEVGRVLEQMELSLADCQVIFKRTDPPFDMRYIFSTYLLDQSGPKTVICNRPAGLRDANEKMIILRFPDLIPATLVTRDVDRIRAFLSEQGGRAVIKPWDGNGGRGIFVLEESDRNLGSLLETSTASGRDHVMLQAYLPEIEDGDKRIILVNGKPEGAFLRVPPKNDHRGNIHVGAVVKACEMTKRDHQICERLSPYLRENGLIFTGIDVIGGKLTEVNVTSPTGIQECTRLYGTHIESLIVDAALEAVEAS